MPQAAIDAGLADAVLAPELIPAALNLLLEKLPSTVEGRETSKEEIQALNEDPTTTNAQLREKDEALPVATADDDPNAAIYADARARAKAHGIEVVDMPSPGLVMVDGDPIPASYMNFYVGNAAVVVPVYGRPNDQAALDALRPFFPGRDIVGLRSDAILSGGGSFHCCSQQMPSL